MTQNDLGCGQNNDLQIQRNLASSPCSTSIGSFPLNKLLNLFVCVCVCVYSPKYFIYGYWNFSFLSFSHVTTWYPFHFFSVIKTCENHSGGPGLSLSTDLKSLTLQANTLLHLLVAQKLFRSRSLLILSSKLILCSIFPSGKIVPDQAKTDQALG